MQHTNISKPHYHLNDHGEFIITDYNSAKPFSSFFPGIAGADGIPMWVFYVNRGQCISGMGIQDKDHPIMEFLPANWAYQLVTSQGFRSFFKLSGDFAIDYYEPFQAHYRDRHLERQQRMIIAPSQLILEEVNHSLNLEFRVIYYTIPRDSFAGMIRVLQIKNTGADRAVVEGLDGLPVIVPYGVDNYCLKNMRRTIEAFVEVTNCETKAPFFKVKVEPADRPDVKIISGGNFYVGFERDGSEMRLVAPVVDPGRVFGSCNDFSFPENFMATPSDRLTADQIFETKFPCAMGLFKAAIAPGEVYTYYSIIGHVSSQKRLNNMIPRITNTAYVESRAQVNTGIIDTITQNNLICSAEQSLNYYVRQNFLDNTLRGGLPLTLGAGQSTATLYLYSRKHGDMERDYNDFRLMPTPYSQGNGNFRDINQNRRSDLIFNPDLDTANVEYFYNLIQLDGFNPLVLKEIYFAADNMEKLNAIVSKYIKDDDLPHVERVIGNKFTPGELLALLQEKEIKPEVDSDIFIADVLDQCREIPDIDYGESYWIDHWTYNLDLLENYLSVFPDRFKHLLFSKRIFSFYDNPHVVQPRDEKYVLWNNTPRQFGAVIYDDEKAHLIEQRGENHNQVRIDKGTGDIYYTTLFVKILSILVNKLASLDPEGVGVEMEAGKPGWYDALNGLPGLFGSSICETLEIRRHILFLLDTINEYGPPDSNAVVFEELHEFMMALHIILNQRMSPLEFWDAASTAKENYRAKTRLGLSGKEAALEFDKIQKFFKAALDKVNEAIDKGRDDKSGTIYTYFRYDISEYSEIQIESTGGQTRVKTNADGLICIRPTAFRQVPLPLFLEGPVHYLRSVPGDDTAREFASKIRQSDLFDKTLKMYKVNASLESEPLSIGRARVFSPGWLENESIWLHMEYKYLLELIRNGLYEEFYHDFKNVCVPFLQPAMYGRSILENSSFLVSSAHSDRSLHGNGFVARLTGATAEFIHILSLMALGPRPFRVNSNGELQLSLQPALPGWLFTQEPQSVYISKNGQKREVELPRGSFSFMFLGDILVTYHNADRRNTYGGDAARPVEWQIVDNTGSVQVVAAENISGELAINIRERKVDKIDILLR